MDEASSFADFARLQILVGRIVRAEPSPKAKTPAYKLWIDFGEGGARLSSAQLTTLYSTEQLVGRLVLAVANFPPKQVADVTSEVLVLGVPVEGSDAVVLIGPDREVPLGARVQ